MGASEPGMLLTSSLAGLQVCGWEGGVVPTKLAP